MPDHQDTISSLKRTASTLRTRVARVVYRAAVVGVLVGWLLFWGNLVRLHYAMGDASSAVITTVFAIIPVAGVLVWYVGEIFDIGVLSPTIGTDILSS